MFGTSSINEEYKEKLFRNKCEINEDDYAVLTSDINYSYISTRDITTLKNYGWNEKEIQTMISENDFDSFTRLAAWIRESGEYEHGIIAEDDGPIYKYPLDEDGNYSETIQCADEYEIQSHECKNIPEGVF